MALDKFEILDFTVKTRIDSLKNSHNTEGLIMEYLYAKKHNEKLYISEAIAEVTCRKSEEIMRILEWVKAMNIL